MKGRRKSIAPITDCAQVCSGCTSPAQRPDGTIKVDENQPRQARRRRVLADSRKPSVADLLNDQPDEMRERAIRLIKALIDED
jgi:hypothetical protein